MDWKERQARQDEREEQRRKERMRLRQARHEERKRQRKLELEEIEKSYRKEQQRRLDEEERQLAELEKKKHEPHSFSKSFRRVKKYMKESKCLAVWEILDHLQEKTIAISFNRDWSPMWYEFGTYSALEKDLGLKRQTAHAAIKNLDGVVLVRGSKYKKWMAFNPEIFDITKKQILDTARIHIDEMEPGEDWRIKITKTEKLVWHRRFGKPKQKKRSRSQGKKKPVNKKGPKRRRKQSRKVLVRGPDGVRRAVWPWEVE